jgi:spermidine synthase
MFLIPKVVETRHSRHNGDIKVYRHLGRYTISVKNLTQSGGLLHPIWKKGLKIAQTKLPQVNRCLILGLGGGTAARLVYHRWPQAKITGIEIDPTMVELGKKYFGLEKLPFLKVVRGNAFNAKLLKGRFDLILVDTYQGDKFPSQASSLATFRRFRRHLTHPGMVIFNRLNWGHFRSQIKAFQTKAKSVFPHTFSHKVLSNILIYCPYA